MESLAQVGRCAIILVTDDQLLGDKFKNWLSEAGIEVTRVHDPVVALGVVEAKPEADLLVTEIVVDQDMRHTLAMTTRPQLIRDFGQLRHKALAKPVSLAALPSEIRRRLAT